MMSLLFYYHLMILMFIVYINVFRHASSNYICKLLVALFSVRHTVPVLGKHISVLPFIESEKVGNHCSAANLAVLPP
jgi:hypothetical protein